MNVPHPFHPDSPEYAAMKAAGRIATDSAPYGGSWTCQEMIEVSTECWDSPSGKHERHPERWGDEVCIWCLEEEPKAYTRCGEPIVTSVPRGFPSSEPLHLCISHGRRLYDEGDRRMEWRCSVCGTRVDYPSHLDPGSGRCNQCLP